jgi:hypothetical protein
VPQKQKPHEPGTRRRVLHRLKLRAQSRQFAGEIFSRRVMGAWWPSRSSKPLSDRFTGRGAFDSLPLRHPSLGKLRMARPSFGEGPLRTRLDNDSKRRMACEASAKQGHALRLPLGEHFGSAEKICRLHRRPSATDQRSQRRQEYAPKRPWRLQSYLAFSSKLQALAFERYIKSGSGHAFANKRLW